MISEEAIIALKRALANGSTQAEIHEACMEKGWSEEDFFFAYKAAENLHNAIQKQKRELKASRKRPNY